MKGLVLLVIVSLFIVSAVSAQTSAPGRIRIPRGGTATQVEGDISTGAVDTWLLAAWRGQILQIAIDAGLLTLIAPSGTVLIAPDQPASTATLPLPETGDYRVQVNAPPGAILTPYSLSVYIPR